MRGLLLVTAALLGACAQPWRDDARREGIHCAAPPAMQSGDLAQGTQDDLRGAVVAPCLAFREGLIDADTYRTALLRRPRDLLTAHAAMALARIGRTGDVAKLRMAAGTLPLDLSVGRPR